MLSRYGGRRRYRDYRTGRRPIYSGRADVLCPAQTGELGHKKTNTRCGYFEAKCKTPSTPNGLQCLLDRVDSDLEVFFRGAPIADRDAHRALSAPARAAEPYPT